jgi:hypothetical protein
VLGCTEAFVQANPNTARAVIMAVLEASRWIDAHTANRSATAQTLAGSAYVNASVEAIRPRMLGHYEDGLGHSWVDRHPITFFDHGAVNYPYLSDGMWFMTQHKRWGLLRKHPDYLAVARAVQQTALYEQAANQLGVDVPTRPLRSSTLIDGVVWDGLEPAAYADSFAIRAIDPEAEAA